jgi:hypothetical protein
MRDHLNNCDYFFENFYYGVGILLVIFLKNNNIKFIIHQK